MKWHSDPGHGWLEVPAAMLKELEIADEISDFSYISRDGKTAYLEEDRDAGIFTRAFAASGKVVEEDVRNLPDEYHEDDRIRGLPPYSSSAIAA